MENKRYNPARCVDVLDFLVSLHLVWLIGGGKIMNAI